MYVPYTVLIYFNLVSILVLGCGRCRKQPESAINRGI